MSQRNKIAIFFTSNFSLVILKTNDFNTKIKWNTKFNNHLDVINVPTNFGVNFIS